MQIHIYIVVIPVLLLIAGIFAASEASLFSLTRGHLEILKSSRPLIYRKIQWLISRPETLLSNIVIGNEILNILIGSFVAEVLHFHFGFMDYKILILLSVTLSTVMLLTFSEVIPKIMAFKFPVLAASTLAYPMAWVTFILTPLRKIFLSVSLGCLRFLNIQASGPSVVSEKEILSLVEAGLESGSLEKDEKEMIFNVFKFSDLTVSSVLTPWSKVFHVKENFTVGDLLELIREKPYSRIPVLSSADQHVIGILYTKELLKLLLSPQDQNDPLALKKAIFPPYIVFVHKKVATLFREFKMKKIHLALVVDEFGKHLGIVTLEDVLNAFFRTPKKTEPT